MGARDSISDLDRLLDRKLLFVTGKGGVGKTTIATALGILSAERGKRVLLCEVEPKGEVGRYFGVREIGFEPVEVRTDLFVMEMDTERALSEYLRLYLKVPIPTKIGPIARTFDFVSKAAPGVREILVVGKLCYEVREKNYDIVIADSTATGHVVSQLASPQGVNELFGVGLVKDQTKWMIDILKDEHQSGICLVSTAEETPVDEAAELAERLRSETGVSLVLGILNKMVPKIFSEAEESYFNEIVSSPMLPVIRRVLGEGIDALVDATSLWKALAASNHQNAERFKSSLGTSIPTIEIPLIPGMTAGVGIVREVAETIEVELT